MLDGMAPSFSRRVRIGGDPAQLGNWSQFPDFTLPGIKVVLNDAALTLARFHTLLYHKPDPGLTYPDGARALLSVSAQYYL